MKSRCSLLLVKGVTAGGPGGHSGVNGIELVFRHFLVVLWRVKRQHIRPRVEVVEAVQLPQHVRRNAALHVAALVAEWADSIEGTPLIELLSGVRRRGE